MAPHDPTELQDVLLNPYPERSLYAALFRTNHRGATVEHLIAWLRENQLTGKGVDQTFPAAPEPPSSPQERDRLIWGIPVHGGSNPSPRELAAARARYAKRLSEDNHMDEEEVQRVIWRQYTGARASIRAMDRERLNPDLIGFYCPFHYWPADQWGIYLRIDKILSTCEHVQRSTSGSLALLTREALGACLLFEIYHHEFFHYLVDCVCAMAELMAGSAGHPHPVYLDYRRNAYESALGRHPHHPLEEALANAYAYQALRYVDRHESGYKRIIVRLYQHLLRHWWPSQGAGYSCAEEYVGAAFTHGTAQLLAMMLAAGGSDPTPLHLLASGALEFCGPGLVRKAQVPTYLLGNDQDMSRFSEIVPFPRRTYTRLYWPWDTSSLDEFIGEREAEDRRAGRERAKQERLRRAAEESMNRPLMYVGPDSPNAT